MHNTQAIMIAGDRQHYHLKRYHRFKVDIIPAGVVVMVTVQSRITEAKGDITIEKLQIHGHIIIIQALIITPARLTRLVRGSHLNSITLTTIQIFDTLTVTRKT